MKVGTCLTLIGLLCAGIAQAQIHVDQARIGCLDIQKDPNLTGLVSAACNGKMSCSYKAPTEAEYRRAGVAAKTRTFCTQGMEIVYHCASGPGMTIEVPGDAWNQAPALLACDALTHPSPIPGSQPGHLRGFVDLHTHPLSNLGFGGKLVYGGADAGSLMPVVGCNHNVYARNEQEALGNDNSTHGGWGPDNLCGDVLRSNVISGFENSQHAAAAERNGGSGYPGFPLWPAWNDLTHQRMWVEWIRRAYYGGLRVMVALAVNNKTLGDMTAGPGDYPTDDKSSADLQIGEIKKFVSRHPDFMEVAYNSSDIYRIVSANKLAVVIGVEIDHIGNLGVDKPSPIPHTPTPPPDAEVKAEIDRLYNEGVRYIFPIHLLDNSSGGAAAFQSVFNASNWRESGHPYNLVCATNPIDNIKDHDEGFTYDNGALQDFLQVTGEMLKLGSAPLSFPSPQCQAGIGQKNSLGLLPSGVVAIKEMMRHGMLIDIDHMSQASADGALGLGLQFGYPMNSGHNGIRGLFQGSYNERSFRADQYATIAKLHGMAGVGSAKINAQQWLTLYQAVVRAMGGSAAAGFGTDMDGLEFAMPPRLPIPPQEVQGPQFKQYEACLRQEGEPAADGVRTVSGAPRTTANSANAARAIAICRKQFPNAFTNLPAVPGSSLRYSSTFPASTDGTKTWNYNSDGVAHYGMLWDFVQDVRSLPGGANMVDNNLMNGADYFAATWRIAEQRSSTVR